MSASPDALHNFLISATADWSVTPSSAIGPCFGRAPRIRPSRPTDLLGADTASSWHLANGPTVSVPAGPACSWCSAGPHSFGNPAAAPLHALLVTLEAIAADR